MYKFKNKVFTSFVPWNWFKWVCMGGWLVCNPILVFFFGPNRTFGLGLGLGPSQTKEFWTHEELIYAKYEEQVFIREVVSSWKKMSILCRELQYKKRALKASRIDAWHVPKTFYCKLYKIQILTWILFPPLESPNPFDQFSYIRWFILDVENPPIKQNVKNVDANSGSNSK